MKQIEEDVVNLITNKVVEFYIAPLVRSQVKRLLFPYLLPSMPVVDSGKAMAFALFNQGKRPSSPEARALDLTKESLYRYFQEWKKLKKS